MRVQMRLSDPVFRFCRELSSEELSAFVEKAYAAGIRLHSDLGFGVQAIIRPDKYWTKTIARLYVASKTIQIHFPEKMDEFRLIVKAFGYEWSNGFWQRTFECDAILCDRASEVAHALLEAGFVIQVEHSEIRDRVINGDFEAEAFRKIKCGTQKPYAGWFVFDYPRDEKHWYDKIMKITAAKYDSGILRVPPEYFAEVEDFAEQHGFIFSEKATEALEKTRSLWESALLVLPAKRKRKGGDVVNPLSDRNVVIPDALKDDTA